MVRAWAVHTHRAEQQRTSSSMKAKLGRIR
jgi:hypothetical protein